MESDMFVPLSEVIEEIIRIQLEVNHENKAVDRKLSAGSVVGALLNRFNPDRAPVDKNVDMEEG